MKMGTGDLLASQIWRYTVAGQAMSLHIVFVPLMPRSGHKITDVCLFAAVKDQEPHGMPDARKAFAPSAVGRNDSFLHETALLIFTYS